MRTPKAIFLVIPLLIGSASHTINAQIKNPSLRGFPVIFYTEETNFAFGGLGILTFDFESNLNVGKPSQINFGAAYTLENQLLLYFPFELYLEMNKWRFEGEIGYYRYTYKYFGIGNDTPESNQETYRVNFPRIQLNALRKVSEYWYAGLSYWYDGYDITKIENGGLLDSNRPAGVSGGTNSGLGITAIYDDRDNIFYTTDGEFVELQGIIDREWLGSNFNFFQLTADAKSFYTNSADHTLGVNLFAEFTGGDVPFQRLALLGGPKQMRGYIEGRYRDNVYLTAQTEYRIPLFKRIGAVAFASAGKVAPSLENFSLKGLKWTAGPGLRYMIDNERKVNIRLDAGFGPGVSGFILTIGEAF